MSDCILGLRNVSKTFPGQVALRDVDLDITQGEIRALVGQNGSGKSTLIKVLAGYHQPDPGARAYMAGVEFDLGTVTAAHRLGLRFVHQDLGVALQLNAIDNIALGGGYTTGRFGRISWAAQRRQTHKMLARFGVDLDMSRPLSDASVVERTAVAIVRALAGWEGGSGLLVLDEPTASLPGPEVERLFEIVREVRAAGTAVLYVSHRLDEIFEIADRVTVLREGRVITTTDVNALDQRDLAALMVGHDVTEGRPARHEDAGDVVLEATGLRGRWLRGVDLTVRRGESVGVAGVLGSGRDELPYVLASAATGRVSGRVTIEGADVPLGRPGAAKKLGIGFVAADRNRESVVPDFNVRENATLAVLPTVARHGVIQRQTESRFAETWINKLGVVPPDGERDLRTLSGGNQQKVIVARALCLGPKVLVLAEPTAGVDIGAREAIYDLLRGEMASGSLSLVVASSDPEDLVSLCHRVIVVRDGVVATELAGVDITPTAILRAMEGLHERPTAGTPERSTQ